MTRVRDPGRIAGPEVIPACVEVRLNWELANSKITHNVLHARVAGGFAATSTVAEAIRVAITSGATWTNYAALLNTATSLTGVSLRDMRAANLPLVDSTGAPVAGTAVGGALPPEVALVVTERTAGAGRSFRGRIFLPGFDKTATTSAGAATGGAVSATQAWAQLIQSGMAGQSLTLAIAQPARQAYTSPVTGAAIPARGANLADVTSLVVRDSIFDSQRRRSRL